MATKLDIETRLDSPRLGDGHALQAVLASALKSRPAPSPPASAAPFWPAAHFGLDRVSAYREASEETRHRILLGCSRGVLAEAYYIEKAGMYFAAKMSLLAESAEERMLYSLSGADEAAHFSWISKYVDNASIASHARDPFTQLLDEVLRHEEREVLCYIVQVILEGWGIGHYRALERGCRDEGLRTVLGNIIKDEGRHHAGGVILWRERPPSEGQWRRLAEVMTRLLQMIQAGPQAVVSQIEPGLGGLSRAQKTRVFEELNCEADAAGKLGVIKSLIASAGGAERLLAEFERRGAFRAFAAAECAVLGQP
jgi:hypothetical protein